MNSNPAQSRKSCESTSPWDQNNWHPAPNELVYLFFKQLGYASKFLGSSRSKPWLSSSSVASMEANSHPYNKLYIYIIYNITNAASKLVQFLSDFGSLAALQVKQAPPANQ